MATAAATTAATATEEFPVLLQPPSSRAGKKYPRAGEPLTPMWGADLWGSDQGNPTDGNRGWNDRGLSTVSFLT